jgi:hypothetical protein
VFGYVEDVSDVGGFPSKLLVGTSVAVYVGLETDVALATTVTDNGGYQFDVPPAAYTLCAGGPRLCTSVDVPVGLVESDLLYGVMTGWGSHPVTSPVTIGACVYGL